MRKIALIVLALTLSGCATFGFPKLPTAPERPSEKTDWKETHKQEIDFVALLAAMSEYQRTGIAPKVPIVKIEDEFSVGHIDTRKPAANPIARLFSWVIGIGGLGTFLYFGGGSLIVFFIGIFIKNFFTIRAALYQTVAGIKASGLATEKGSPLHTALETAQDEKIKVLVKNIRNKV